MDVQIIVALIGAFTGIIVAIIGGIFALKSKEKKSKDSNVDKQKNNIIIPPEQPTFEKNLEKLPRCEHNEQNIAFVKELKRNSPVNDQITISKHEFKD